MGFGPAWKTRAMLWWAQRHRCVILLQMLSQKRWISKQSLNKPPLILILGDCEVMFFLCLGTEKMMEFVWENGVGWACLYRKVNASELWPCGLFGCAERRCICEGISQRSAECINFYAEKRNSAFFTLQTWFGVWSERFWTGTAKILRNWNNILHSKVSAIHTESSSTSF